MKLWRFIKCARHVRKQKDVSHAAPVSGREHTTRIEGRTAPRERRRGWWTLSAALALTAIASAVDVPTAAAHRSTTHRSTDPVALALAHGERYWRTVPCHGEVTVSTSDQLPSELSDPDINQSLQAHKSILLAWTSFETPSGPNQIALNPDIYTRCVITLNGNLWRDWRIDDGEWQWLCDAMTHELGHLLGHSDEGQLNPASIEYPVLEPGSPNYNSVPQCRRVVLWYGRERFVR